MDISSYEALIDVMSSGLLLLMTWTHISYEDSVRRSHTSAEVDPRSMKYSVSLFIEKEASLPSILEYK